MRIPKHQEAGEALSASRDGLKLGRAQLAGRKIKVAAVPRRVTLSLTSKVSFILARHETSVERQFKYSRFATFSTSHINISYNIY